MKTIYLETVPLGNNLFELMQSFEVDGKMIDDNIITNGYDDRMIAAMTNLGLACRHLIDNSEERGEVCLITDKDGKATRYGGEHDYLYAAVRSRQDYVENRAKYRAIYQKHVAYLDRIRGYADQLDLQITCRGLHDAPAVTSVADSFGGYDVTQDTLPPPIQFVNLDEYATNNFKLKDTPVNPRTLITISIAKHISTATCTICREQIQFEQTDAYRVRRFDSINPFGRTVSVLCRTPDILLRHFQKVHLFKHRKQREWLIKKYGQ